MKKIYECDKVMIPFDNFNLLILRIIIYSYFPKLFNMQGYADKERYEISHYDQRIVYYKKEDLLCYYRWTRTGTEVWSFKSRLSEEDVKFLKNSIYWFPELFIGL